MKYVRLTREQQRAICEDLLAIERAGRLSDVWALQRQMLREHPSPSPWEWVDADSLAGEASLLIGGTPHFWLEAAVAALGIPSRVDVCIEAVCRVAEDVRQQAAPPRAHMRHRVTVGNRKRGGR